MYTNLVYSFGKITEKSAVLHDAWMESDDKFLEYMDNVFTEIKKADKRNNSFKLLFL